MNALIITIFGAAVLALLLLLVNTCLPRMNQTDLLCSALADLPYLPESPDVAKTMANSLWPDDGSLRYHAGHVHKLRRLVMEFYNLR